MKLWVICFLLFYFLLNKTATGYILLKRKSSITQVMHKHSMVKIENTGPKRHRSVTRKKWKKSLIPVNSLPPHFLNFLYTYCIYTNILFSHLPKWDPPVCSFLQLTCTPKAVVLFPRGACSPTSFVLCAAMYFTLWMTTVYPALPHCPKQRCMPGRSCCGTVNIPQDRIQEWSCWIKDRVRFWFRWLQLVFKMIQTCPL